MTDEEKKKFYEYRLTAHEGEFEFRKPKPGDHSLTHEEVVKLLEERKKKILESIEKSKSEQKTIEK